MDRVLKDTFRLYPNTDVLYDVELFEKCIVFEPCAKNNACGGSDRSATLRNQVSLDEVIGCHVMKVAEEVTSLKHSVSYFCIYAYHLVQKRKNAGPRRQKRTYVFEVDKEVSYEGNLAVSRLWQSALLWLLRGVKLQRTTGGGAVIPQELPAQRHYLVIVNPKSGPGRSLEIFLHRVRPILAEADISHLLLVTERQNHAKEFIKSLNLKQWSGILVISGDGLLFEVYNGLMERPDWEQAVKIPIGIIPGGSGNGLARSISHTANEPYVSDPIVAATLGVAKGRISPLDLMLVETPKGALYSFLTVGWGIMADIDIESERLRAIGEIRFTLWAFWRVFNLRTYQGRISYLPATVPPKNGVPPSTASAAPKNPAPQTSNSSASNDRRPASVPANNGGLHRSQSAPEGYANLNQSQEELADGDNVLPAELEVVADSSMTRAPEPTVAETPLAPPDGFPSLDDPVPDDWTVEEGRFIIIYSSLQSHLGTNLFFAPEARLDDGVAWLLMIRGDATRLQLLTYFKAQEEGHHVDLPYVRLIPVRAFRLEAFANSTVTVDGELVRTKVLQARVLPSLGRILTI